MSNILEQLVQQVAYMFYRREKTMVLIGLLDLGRQVNLDELSELLKFRKNDLAKVLGALKQDRLIRVDPIEDLEGVEDYDQLTKAQKAKLIKDYYSIDFKSFVDSVNLKILISREELKKQCGPEDNIFYKCPKCEETYSLNDIISSTDIDDGLFCPNCHEKLEMLNDSDEKNHKRKMYEDFVKITDPLLDLIKKTDGLVMINDPDQLCKSDKLIPIQEYNQTKQRLENEIRIKRITSHRSNTSFQSSTGKREDIIVSVNTGQPSTSYKEDNEEIDEISKLIDMQEKVQEKSKEEEPKKSKTIVLFGQEYGPDDIDDDLMQRVAEECPPEKYDEVIAFKENLE